MNLTALDDLIERLRTETVGNPNLIRAKGVFEYEAQSIEVVVILKLVRSAQGIHALELLCRSGLFVDMGAIYRCVGDCIAEVYFLLETYPNQSGNVEKFIKEFFSRTIDGHLSSEESVIPTKKIHSAMERFLAGGRQNESARGSIDRIYKTFSGYTHASYAHIMQMYGGPRASLSFNIAGIPSPEQRDSHMKLVLAAHQSLVFAMAHAARIFKRNDLYTQIRRYSKDSGKGTAN